MRILHTDFHTGWGGQASRILMLSSELVRRGHEVTIAAPPGELSARARQAGAHLAGLKVEDGFAFRSPGHAASFIKDGRRMERLLGRSEFDIVDVHGSQDTWVTASVRALTGRPSCLVMTRHNTKRVRTGFANRFLYGRLVDHLIIVDESVRKGYEPFLADGTLSASRISVIPSAYRSDLFHPGVKGAGVRAELKIPADAIAVGVAGRLVEDKGHTYLLKAVAAIQSRVPGLVLVFAGMGPNESRLRAEAAELGLAESVRFLGFRSDIPEVTAAFDIAVLPSVGCDASSASLKEAMALGLPVIATDIGGARGILTEGSAGVIVPPADPEALAAQLLRLIDDPGAARGMGERARREVERRYSIARLADQTLDAYQTALTRLGLRRKAGTAAGKVGQGRTA
ncbi:MAG TPA: glycosyltransferase family 4 protein [Candidatus Polarisedimenticolia bacterium]|nr:glycosyltransferase family 4 protein [Candidatus Polarisedimenticolia bacterium]